MKSLSYVYVKVTCILYFRKLLVQASFRIFMQCNGYFHIIYINIFIYTFCIVCLSNAWFFLFCMDGMYILSRLHVVYCLQLERFLCRECGNVKCSCSQRINENQQNVESHPPIDVNNENIKESANNDMSDSIEYRKPAAFTRQYSRSEQPNNFTTKCLPLSLPKSDQPFQRSFQNENGKLRRSFIVRSREGLENFLNFSSTRKGQDQEKGKQTLRQQL